MLRSTVAAIQAAADEVGEAPRRLSSVDPGATAFGAGGLGLLGEVGREAYRHWQAALDARASEAQAYAQRLRELAALVERTGAGLTEAEVETTRAQRETDPGAGAP